MDHRSDVTRDAILRDACKLFAQRGCADVSVATVAEAAGVSKSLVYHYFNSKEELVAAALGAAATEAESALSRATDRAVDAKARLSCVLELMCRPQPCFSKHCEMIVDAARHLAAQAPSRPLGVFEKTFALLKSCLEDVLASGNRDATDAHMGAMMILAAVHGLWSLSSIDVRILPPSFPVPATALDKLPHYVRGRLNLGSGASR